MAIAASLVATLGLDSAQFSEGLRRAGGSLKGFQRTAARVTQAVTAGAIGFTYTSRQALLAADEIAKSARNAGLSAEAYQRLAQSFELGGSSAQALVKGNQALARNIRDLGRGLSTQADAFDQLNLSYGDLRDLSPEEQFLLVRERLAGVTNETQRSAIAQQLFGRAGKEFGTILTENNETLRQQGIRIQELGGVMSNEALGAAELFNDELGTLTRVIQTQFTNAIGEGLSQLDGFSEGNYDMVIKTIGEGVRSATDAIVGMITTLYEWRNVIAAVFVAWAAVKALMFSQAALAALTAFAGGIKLITISAAPLLLAIGKVVLIAAALIAIVVVAVATINGAVKAFDSFSAAVGKFFEGTLEKANRFGLRWDLFWLELQIDFYKWLDENLKGFTEFVNDAIDIYNKVAGVIGQEPIALVNSDGIKQLEGDAEALRKAIAESVMKSTELFNAASDLGSDAGDEFKEGFFKILEDLRAGLGTLGADLGLGGSGDEEDPTPTESPSESATKDAEEETMTFWEKIKAAFERGSKSTEETVGQELSDSLSQNLSSAIAKGDWGSLGDIFLNTIQNVLQDRIADQLNEVLGTIFDSIFGAILGGFGGGKADGGPVRSDRTYLVGERGPELFTPSSAGNIIPNEALGGGGGGQIVVNYGIQGDSSEEIMRVVRMSGDEIATNLQGIFTERGVGGFQS